MRSAVQCAEGGGRGRGRGVQCAACNAFREALRAGLSLAAVLLVFLVVGPLPKNVLSGSDGSTTVMQCRGHAKVQQQATLGQPAVAAGALITAPAGSNLHVALGCSLVVSCCPSYINICYIGWLPKDHNNAWSSWCCACRYQAAYRELAKKHPSFRERSETTELIVDISLQVCVHTRPHFVLSSSVGRVTQQQH